VNPDASQPIPAVDSQDLRAVWELTQQSKAQLPAEQSSSFGIDVALVAQVCSPEANVFAVFMRSALLEVLIHEGLLTAPLDPAVFDVAAAFPIPAFDQFNPKDFVRQLDSRPGKPS
jgi:hypothetical protein